MRSEPRAFRRTTVAAALVGVAVLVPTAAWYVTGSREVARQVRLQLEEASNEVGRRVEHDADRLGTRLTTLIARESSRPFYHYQNLFHDPLGAAQGLAVTRSPLAAGVSDPLVLAHFQIGEDGTVTLPTVNERFPELSSDEGFGQFCEVLGELQNGLVVPGETGRDRPIEGEQVLVLEPAAWRQIRLAESVYASLTGRSQASKEPATTVSEDRPQGRVVVRIGPLKWHTLVLGSGPTLAALREVMTPDGLLVQGFALASAAVTEWLGTDLSFAPVAPHDRHLVSVPVSDTGRYLTADAGPLLDAASLRASQIRRQFRRGFALSSAATLSAAFAVVLIVAQTDRLARQRAQFAATAAHELKTPLATLRLHSEMLAEGLGDPAHARSYAERIAPEVRRLGRVVSNMLDLSRLERGAALVRPFPGDVGRAVAECVGRLEPTLTQAGLVVGLDVEPELPQALFDRDALFHILDNLLDNAEKHTRQVAGRRVSVAVTAGGPGVRLTVADNGPGIPRRAQRRLFRPFARDDDSGGAGLGLGLALARSLARAQGGDLQLVDTADGTEGAVFALTLRAAAG